MSHIGENLRVYRNRKGLSQQFLANKLGISLRSLQEIEKTGTVSKSLTMQRIAYLLRKDVGDNTGESVGQQESTEPLSLAVDLGLHADQPTPKPKQKPKEVVSEVIVEGLEERVAQLKNKLATLEAHSLTREKVMNEFSSFVDSELQKNHVPDSEKLLINMRSFIEQYLLKHN